jgi:hypothetical protein
MRHSNRRAGALLPPSCFLSVLIDNPQKGYGIFAETMLETAQSVANEQLKYAS